MIIYHIMQAGWNSEYYTLFSALVLGFILLIIVCTLISIIFIYAQLCQGNYVWWWKSFVISGSMLKNIDSNLGVSSSKTILTSQR
jgi:hypothetical protein